MKKRYMLLIVTALALGGALLLKRSPTEDINESNEEAFIRPRSTTKPDSAPQTRKSVAVAVSEAASVAELPSLDEFPTISDLQNLSEDEVHHTPEAVLNGGRLVGQLIDRAEKNPALREKTVLLLKSCAESDEVVTAVRAVCWKNTVDQMKNWRVFVPLSDMKVPPQVLELSSQLP